MPNSLRQRVEEFISRPLSRDELAIFLKECVLDGGLEALTSVCRLYEDMYDGITFNMEAKGPSASALLAWKESGLLALAEGAKRTPTGKNLALAMQFLAMAASGDVANHLFQIDPVVEEKVNAATNDPAVRKLAATLLVELILSLDDEDDVALYIGTTLTAFSFSQVSAAKQLITALSRRWMAMSTPVLNEFDDLIRTRPSEEPVFQAFLANHPQLLDPLAHEVWPQPNLFGFRQPDFIVKRADGTYMVVEIECPSKTLVTAGGQISASAIHAEQ